MENNDQKIKDDVIFFDDDAEEEPLTFEKRKKFNLVSIEGCMVSFNAIFTESQLNPDIFIGFKEDDNLSKIDDIRTFKIYEKLIFNSSAVAIRPGKGPILLFSSVNYSSWQIKNELGFTSIISKGLINCDRYQNLINAFLVNFIENYSELYLVSIKEEVKRVLDSITIVAHLRFSKEFIDKHETKNLMTLENALKAKSFILKNKKIRKTNMNPSAVLSERKIVNALKQIKKASSVLKIDEKAIKTSVILSDPTAARSILKRKDRLFRYFRQFNKKRIDDGIDIAHNHIDFQFYDETNKIVLYKITTIANESSPSNVDHIFTDSSWTGNTMIVNVIGFSEQTTPSGLLRRRYVPILLFLISSKDRKPTGSSKLYAKVLKLTLLRFKTIKSVSSDFETGLIAAIHDAGLIHFGCYFHFRDALNRHASKIKSSQELMKILIKWPFVADEDRNKFLETVSKIIKHLPDRKMLKYFKKAFKSRYFNLNVIKDDTRPEEFFKMTNNAAERSFESLKFIIGKAKMTLLSLSGICHSYLNQQMHKFKNWAGGQWRKKEMFQMSKCHRSYNMVHPPKKFDKNNNVMYGPENKPKIHELIDNYNKATLAGVFKSAKKNKKDKSYQIDIEYGSEYDDSGSDHNSITIANKIELPRSVVLVQRYVNGLNENEFKTFVNSKRIKREILAGQMEESRVQMINEKKINDLETKNQALEAQKNDLETKNNEVEAEKQELADKLASLTALLLEQRNHNLINEANEMGGLFSKNQINKQEMVTRAEFEAERTARFELEAKLNEFIQGKANITKEKDKFDTNKNKIEDSEQPEQNNKSETTTTKRSCGQHKVLETKKNRAAYFKKINH